MNCGERGNNYIA